MKVQFGVCNTLVDGVIIQRCNRSKGNDTSILTPTEFLPPRALRLIHRDYTPMYDALYFFVLTSTPQHPPKSGILQSFEDNRLGQWSFHPSVIATDPPFEYGLG